MLDIFVGKALAPRTLRQTHAFAQRLVIGFAVRRIQRLHGEPASVTRHSVSTGGRGVDTRAGGISLDAYWHCYIVRASKA